MMSSQGALIEQGLHAEALNRSNSSDLICAFAAQMRNPADDRSQSWIQPVDATS